MSPVESGRLEPSDGALSVRSMGRGLRVQEMFCFVDLLMVKLPTVFCVETTSSMRKGQGDDGTFHVCEVIS